MRPNRRTCFEPSFVYRSTGKRGLLRLLQWMVCATIATAAAADTHYVNKANTTPQPGYTNGWASAATSIQDALDWAVNGDVVLVTNGVYDTGGLTNWPAGSTLTNRVTITNTVTVRSVNGPASTLIVGAYDNGWCGPAAVRCVYICSNASLVGFTLTNGATLAGAINDSFHVGGGVLCDNSVVSNCWIYNNLAGYGGAGFSSTSGKDGTVLNSRIVGNLATNSGSGGGVYGGNVRACVISSNRAYGSGGGACYVKSICDSEISYNYLPTLRGGGMRLNTAASNCVIIYNTAAGASGMGGGVYMEGAGALHNCLVAYNSAARGGGAYRDSGDGSIYGSTIASNTALYDAGGARYCTLYNCKVIGNYGGNQQGGGLFGGTAYNTLIIGNAVAAPGGGASGASLQNCTVAFNYATRGAGGVTNCTCTNTIVCFNEAPVESNYASTVSFSYSCALPLPSGTGNIDSEPSFTAPGTGIGTNHVPGVYRLSPYSPCADKAQTFPWMLPGDAKGRHLDLDGQKRIWGPAPDMGAYERITMGTTMTGR